MRRLTPKILAALAVAIAAMAGPVGSTPAQAEPVPHTLCTTTTDFLTIFVEPGMRLLPGEIRDFYQGVEEPVAPCTPVLPNGWAGQFTLEDIQGEGRMACVISDTTTLDGTIEIEWSDGVESTLDIEATSIFDLTLSPQADRAITFVGDVSGGKFEGDEFRLVTLVTTPTPNASLFQCTLDPNGLDEFSGTFSLTVGEGIL